MAIVMKGVCPLIQVFDMAAALRFYRDVLGFGIVARSADSDDCDWVWLRCAETELMLNTAYERETRPAAPDPARIKAHEDTGLFIGCPDVDGAYEHLRAHGVKLAPPQIAPYGMKQLYVTDPDGYEICFQWSATT